MSDLTPEDEGEEPAPPADEVAETSAPARPTRPKHKKKRRAAAPTPELEESEAEAPGAEPIDDGTPAFARKFPRDPELTALVTAFEQGNYARVRRDAPALAQKTEDDDIRAAARELARRLDPDPTAVYLLAVAAALLVFLAGWYWLHPHTP